VGRRGGAVASHGAVCRAGLVLRAAGEEAGAGVGEVGDATVGDRGGCVVGVYADLVRHRVRLGRRDLTDRDRSRQSVVFRGIRERRTRDAGTRAKAYGEKTFAISRRPPPIIASVSGMGTA